MLYFYYYQSVYTHTHTEQSEETKQSFSKQLLEKTNNYIHQKKKQKSI